MVLPIVKYGHPALRKKGARVNAANPALRQLVEDLLDTMYANHGLGLAAQQVGEALQIAVVDVREVKDRPSTMEVDGQAVDLAARMPLVLLNPEVQPLTDAVSGPEGCLSFPEMYADISRPEAIEVKATGAKGELLHFRCGGLLARAIQHEWDHLQGILFIDRMSRETKAKLKDELTDLQVATKLELKQGQAGR